MQTEFTTWTQLGNGKNADYGKRQPLLRMCTALRGAAYSRAGFPCHFRLSPRMHLVSTPLAAWMRITTDETCGS
jgi:hypothetical protein